MHHAPVAGAQLRDLLEVLLTLELPQLPLLREEQLHPLPLLVIHVRDDEVLEAERGGGVARAHGQRGRGRGGPMMSPGASGSFHAASPVSGTSEAVGSVSGSGGGFLNFFPLDIVSLLSWLLLLLLPSH